MDEYSHLMMDGQMDRYLHLTMLAKIRHFNEAVEVTHFVFCSYLGQELGKHQVTSLQ